MNKRIVAYLASGLLLFGAVTSVGVYQARADKTAAPLTQTDNAQQEQKDEQNPAYTSSVQTNNQQDATEVKGQDQQDQDNEATESSSLQLLAKINADNAKAAALKAVPGTAKEVSLDNENENVVYSVEVQTAKGTVDVKVDAGNGQVLSQDSEEDNDRDNNIQEKDTQEGAHEADNDNIQLEQ